MADGGGARHGGPDEASLVWLASYPKSGNTWLRVLLGHLFPDTARPNRDSIFAAGSISSDRSLFDNATGIASSDLTADEIDLLRPGNYRRMAQRASGTPVFIKAHDSCYRNARGELIFPEDCTRGAILIVRHPMDVAISYAHHRGGTDYAAAVTFMESLDKNLAGAGKSQFHQRTTSWSGHYLSWARQKAIPVLIVRYEDMLRDAGVQLGRVLSFIGEKSGDEPAIARAVEQSRFERLQALERVAGFRERPPEAERFFRTGRAGEGITCLPQPLRERIWDHHHSVMTELGYGFDGLAQ